MKSFSEGLSSDYRITECNLDFPRRGAFRQDGQVQKVVSDVLKFLRSRLARPYHLLYGPEISISESVEGMIEPKGGQSVRRNHVWINECYFVLFL